MTRLNDEKFLWNGLKLAPYLLGCEMFVEAKHGKICSGIINEVEYYGGSDDPASHAHRGRTPRSDIMFQEGGSLYVYFIYGMYHCANIVCGPAGQASAILIRSLIPKHGIDVMKNRRQTNKIENLCSGPGKLCQALGLGMKDNGLVFNQSRVWIEDKRQKIKSTEIIETPRIGISKAQEKNWRFVWKT